MKNSQLVHVATRQTLLMLGLNHGLHGLVADAAAVASIGSSPLHHQLYDLPRMSSTPTAHDFQRHHLETSHLSYSTGSGSPKVSVVAPGTPTPAGIDINAMHVGGGSSFGCARKRPHELAADTMKNARNLFDRMSAA
ncbi:DNA repair protein rhp54 [Hordeum vulgare]|nr:DNA repair protein rhp54 [Hordeum vulgare]